MPKPIITHETSQYDDRAHTPRFDCPCPPCTASRTHYYQTLDQPRMRWHAILAGIFMLSAAAAVVWLILALAFPSTVHAREGTVRPIVIPAEIAHARKACPFDQPLKCRAALVHAYQAIAWARKLRTHTAPVVELKHLPEFTCIHRGEGAWNSRTGNGYFGGLQMDSTFERTYGADMLAKYGDHANTWSPRDQMIVAERAYRTRGFHPWPNTARACGLL